MRKYFRKRVTGIVIWLVCLLMIPGVVLAEECAENLSAVMEYDVVEFESEEIYAKENEESEVCILEETTDILLEIEEENLIDQQSNVTAMDLQQDMKEDCVDEIVVIEEISVEDEQNTLDSEEYVMLEPIFVTEINPLYQGLITEGDLLQPDLYGASLIATVADYGTYEEAVTTLSTQLKSKQLEPSVMLKTTRDDYKQMSRDLFAAAIDTAAEHTGNPVLGDYLRWGYGGWSAAISVSIGSLPETYYVTINYTVTFYTTQEQEAEVTNKVMELINSLGLSDIEKSDYEKVKEIYNYICSTVTYDYGNLNDESYKLKFTAYAALMHKTAVCQGYALLFYRMALECGIDARLIDGTGNGGNHGWNIVKLGNYYYNLDSTWDAGKTEENYRYFLKSPNNFGGHIRSEVCDSEAFHAKYPMDSQDYVPSGYIQGDGWIYEQGILTITGSIDDFAENDQPWSDVKEDIQKIIIAEGVISIGSNAFAGCSNLNEIRLPDSITEVDDSAFSGCAGIETIKKTDGTEYTITELCEKGIGEAFSDTSWYAHTCTPETAVIENETASTCKVKGTYDEVVYCVICKEELSRITKEKELLRHTEVVDAAVDPTCTTEGKTEGSHCKVCGTVTKEQEPMSALGHTEVVDAAVDPTCTTEGKTEGSHCKVCGTVTKEQEPMSALGHTEVVDAAVEPTCTTEGKTEGSHCKVCGTVIRKQETIAASGHTDVVDAAVEPTCTTPGKTEGSHCKVCGTVTKKQETVVAAGHTKVTDAAVKPTCTSEGKTEGSHCSACGEILVKQQMIAKLAHTGEWKTTETATIKAPEQQEKICTACETVETRSFGKALEPFISFNASSLRMKKGQTSKVFQVNFADGDSVKKLKTNKKNMISVSVLEDGVLKIKALKKTGTVKLTVTLESGLKKTVSVKIVSNKITTSSLNVSPKKKTIRVGKTYGLQPVIKPITSQDKVTYTSSNKKVATVTSKGVVKGRKKGTAKITIRSGKKVVTVKITVKK